MGIRTSLMGLLAVFLLSLTGITFSSLDSAQAEPWLSNRFANNCASCHAPSRLNLKAKERRCTLSCQGCHTNPNGGGLRNFYGKWNSQRWLRNLHSKTLNNKKKPLPWFAQRYISERDTRKIMSALKSKRASKRVDKKILPKTAKFKRELSKAISSTKYIRKGKPTRRTLDEGDVKRRYSEAYYLRENGDDSWTRTARSRKQFEDRIPRDDPYFQRRRSAFNAGFDLRYQTVMDSEREYSPDTTDKIESTWPMSFDVALELRPFYKNKTLGKIGFVTETRYANSYTNTDPESIFASGAVNKSAYVIMDDLMYNTFVMFGFYRPMFEHYTSDHTALTQTILWGRSSYSHNFKALSIGLAPNVPFFNIHLIQPKLNSSTKDSGYILNLGARAVKYGASIRYSVMALQTETTGSSELTETTASSLTAGFKIGPSITNLQALILERVNSATNRGTTIGLEQRFKLGGENYIEMTYETSNTSEQLLEGSSQMTTLGYRTFLWSGSDFTIRYKTYENKPTTPVTNVDNEKSVASIEAQMHIYY